MLHTGLGRGRLSSSSSPSPSLSSSRPSTVKCLYLYVSLSLCCLCNLLSAELIHYQSHFIQPQRPEYLVIPKFDRSEVPHWTPGKGRSYIDLSHLKLKSACAMLDDPVAPPPMSVDKESCKGDTTFDLLMFKASLDNPDRSWKDFWGDGDFCCTQRMIDDGDCTASQLNRLIIPSDLPSETLPRSTLVPPDEETYLIGEDQVSRHDVKKSGVYIIVMAVCDPAAAPIAVEGSIDSMDPYGYLPGDLFGNLPFYLSLTCMYMIVALTWGVLCATYWDQLMPLQYWISGVLIAALFETTLLYSHYLDWNDYGYPSLGITFIGLIFGVIKRAASRVLVQLVALGYGVVRPSLGEDMNKVLYLGGAYFVLSFIYTMLVSMPSGAKQLGDPEYDFVSMIVFLMAVVDTTFYIWIFTSINNLMVTLASRKQGVKYVLYRNFRSVLFVMLGLTVLWAIYGSVIFINDGTGASPYWRAKWTVDALWELIYFVIFSAIAILWAPSNNSQRYAYSIELTQLDDDAEYNEVANATALTADNDGDLDDEYGGRLNDDKDPFQGTGALDPTMAITKKN